MSGAVPNLAIQTLRKAAEHAAKMSRHGVTIRLCWNADVVMVIGTIGDKKAAEVIDWEEVEKASLLVGRNPVALAVTEVYNVLTKTVEKVNGTKVH